MVIDIEGPFPRSRDVYCLVLTGMCFNSRFPEVVLAETVVEAMVDIFCRTGVPKQILMEQGLQFMDHLSKQVCKKLGIQEI